MLEESLPLIWMSMQSWLTPSVLFVLINIMIGTIFFSSSSVQTHENNEAHQLSRRPSVLERLTSINLCRQRTQELVPPTITTIEVKPLETIRAQEPEKITTQDEKAHLGRIRSDTHPAAGELPRKMKKCGSHNTCFGRLCERKVFVEEEEGVDARADDFINRFKQQLRLQRLN